ncbi:hypothetical protein IJT17_02550, partial [bacterium]|nr:hypothetical protein [bacterium]
YPDGLVGEDIPLIAQIVSVADVYDALINKRCYKESLDLSQAYDMIISGQCGTFSPKILECFKRARESMEKFAKEPFVNPLDNKKRKLGLHSSMFSVKRDK